MFSKRHTKLEADPVSPSAELTELSQIFPNSAIIPLRTLRSHREPRGMAAASRRQREKVPYRVGGG